MSSTMASASSTATASPQSSGNATALALGISLAVVGTIVFGGLAFYFVRRHMKRKKAEERAAEMSSVKRRTYMVSVDPTHLAARVTPFGVGVNAAEVEIPKFVHNPGANMRVAYRRSDGGWSFHENSTSNQSMDLQRDGTITTLYSRPTKDRKLQPGELTTRGYVEPDVEGNPPPAYYHEEDVLSDSTTV